METQERLILMADLAAKEPGIGKTAMMKLMYLLQTLYKVPLGYDYKIYTYGPYCQTVMSDIEYAEFMNYISVEPITYKNGMSGYKIEATELGVAAINASTLDDKYANPIHEVVAFFGQKKARDLELYSTIVFVYFSCLENGWDNSKEEICNTVKSIKPHFTLDTIKFAFDDLLAHQFIS